LARKQYRCEPQEAWATWPEQPAVASPLPRYLVRPESPTADVFWLQVDLMEMSSQWSERHLVRLRDVTASVVMRSNVWTFHALVSHKLRTPLTLVTGFLDILEEDWSTLPEVEKKSFLSAARKVALRLQDEILDILQYMEVPDIVKPGQGRCGLAEFSALIAEINSSLQLKSINIASYEGIEDPNDVYVSISCRAMELVLWELFENAKKFHPEQSPTLEIKISGISEGIRIQVCDDGLTLSPDQLAKMWIPYYQAEKYFTGQVAGMGLGLSMVASLVWGVGGACRIYNREEGSGVVVELVLPLAKGDGEANG